MAKIYYARVDEFWRKGEKYAYLEEKQHSGNIAWQELQPDAKHNWLTEGMHDEFATFLSLGTKESKSSKAVEVEAIFKTFSSGVNTARDNVVYGFSEAALLKRIKQFCDDYNAELYRYQEKGQPKDIDEFSSYEKVKWSEGLKNKLKSKRKAVFDSTKTRTSLYRVFTKLFLYYDSFLIDRPGLFRQIYPNPNVEVENRTMCIPSIGARTGYWCLCINLIPSLTLISVDINQCFPFYMYNEDGTNRRENITDWALEQFCAHYRDVSISKWDIFHYVYSLLHHPFYRERYSANLKRELPRIPYAPDFQAFARAGARLSDLHVNYEQQPEYPLERIENPAHPLDWRVTKMKLARDKRALRYNDFLTLDRIPPEAFEYRLGNRSALEWVVDQYQLTTDKRSGITNDPNRHDDPQYILRLIGQVITVSLETVEIVRSLPDLGIAGA